MTEERVRKLEESLHEVLLRLRIVETNQARAEVAHDAAELRFGELNKRFDKLEGTITKLFWTVLTGIGIPIILFVLSGGTVLGG